MPNPKGNPSTLKPFTGKWSSGETKVIPVPKSLADEVLAYARVLDAGGDDSDTGGLSTDSSKRLLQVIEGLKRVHQFPRNNFSRERKAFLRDLIDELSSIAGAAAAEPEPADSGPG